ncbi:hypothetical protein CTAYLR_008804 [Chrysophaeum taylorii]|uniref:Polycystin cation channel PKD1/PKD2 domain-containing protein n=1 Tax=Chrysophaeum taylorii TaxID=2483200 RepID=A0AAD7UDG8_9STRA|nr:hypothetical protein CTAYLR_008804 [Chrysophaeum taylorii]
MLAERLQQQLHWLEDALARMTVGAGVFFVFGSLDFLPDRRRNETRQGCLLFLVGNTIYLAAAAFDLEEAITARANAYEICMNAAYVLGSLTYVVATLFYIPEVVAVVPRAPAVGSDGFIAGSALFVLAGFLNHVKAQPHARFLVIATSATNFLGAQLFLVASVIFHPALGCGDQARRTATLMFVAGSLAFTLSGILPILPPTTGMPSSSSSEPRAARLKGVRECASQLEGLFAQLGRLSPIFHGPIAAYRHHARRCEEIHTCSMSSHGAQNLSSALRVYDEIGAPAASRVAASVDDGRVVDGADEFRALADATLVLDSAWKVADAVHAQVRADLEQKRGYFQMVKYLATTCSMLVVVVAQRGYGGYDRTNMYQAIKGEMFGMTTAVTSGGVEVVSHLTDETAFLEWIEANVLDSIFAGEICGDGVCNQPEEMPYYQANAEARLFTGCESDCGRASTKRVRVSFTDPWKLWYAAKHAEAAVRWGWAGRTSDRWNSSDRLPAAGWNLCATNHTEYGAFETFCLFDGDIFVDGKPYRADELDVNSTSFGQPIELDLFEAEWELRIVYANFTWPDLSTSTATPPRAFPAVRGQVCQDVGGGNWGECATWAPCADSETCRCEFYDSTYRCFDEASWTTRWDASYYDFARSTGLRWLGEWWNVNSTRNVTTLDDVEDRANRTLADDYWFTFSSDCGETYYVVVADNFQDGGWNEATLEIIDDVTGEVVIEDVAPRAYFYDDDATSHEDYWEVRLCATSSYRLSVAPDCNPAGLGGVSWALVREKTWAVVSSGTECTKNCDPMTTASCPYDCSAYDDDYCSRVGARRRRRNLAGDDDDNSTSSADDDAAATDDDDDDDDDDDVLVGDDAADDVVFNDDTLVDDDSNATSSPTASAVPTPAPTTGAPSASPMPTTSTPTAFPTSLSNAFGSDLRPIASDNQHFFMSDACSPTGIRDAVCDNNNNLASCGWDGGDCCMDTCTGSGGNDCSLAASDCTSPAELGSETADGDACAFSYARRILQGADDDDDEADTSSSPGSCTPIWPYNVKFSRSDDHFFDFHPKVPFVAYEALRDVLTVRTGATVPHEDMPSMFCGDCSLEHLSSPYQRFSFRVEPNETAAYPMFPNIQNLARERYYVRPNVVLIGGMLTTVRYETEECAAGERLLEKRGVSPQKIDGVESRPELSCSKDQKYPDRWRWSFLPGHRRRQYKANRFEREPYGTDATFMDAAPVYRASNAIDDFYDAETEINEWGVPFGFFYRQGATSQRVKDFPIVFDVNLNVSRYRDLMTSIEYGSYVDLKTRKITFKLALLNSETGLLALVQSDATRLDGGGLSTTWSISLVDALPYHDARDWCRLAGEIIYVIFLFYSIGGEVAEILRHGATAYLTDWMNWIDVLSFASQVALASSWISHAILCSSIKVQAHAQVYQDFFAVGRVLRAGPGLSTAFDLYDDLDRVVKSGDFYVTMVAASFFLSILQFLKTLHFHPKLGLTTSTIFAAAQDLAFFAFLFVFVLGTYAVLGVLLFGERLPAFSTLGFSLMSLVDILFGDFGSIADLKNHGNAFIIVFFYTFLVISSLVLLNALLAIIVDAYAAVKDQARHTSREVLVTLICELVGWTSPPKPFYVSQNDLDLVLAARARHHRAVTTLEYESTLDELPKPPSTAKVLLVSLGNDSPASVVLTQPMLQEVLDLAADASFANRNLLELVCFNIVEQHGVEPRMASEHDAELLALALNRELSLFAKCYDVTTLARLSVALVATAAPLLARASK